MKYVKEAYLCGYLYLPSRRRESLFGELRLAGHAQKEPGILGHEVVQFMQVWIFKPFETFPNCPLERYQPHTECTSL
jgi:hypothetical protein